MSLGPHYFIFGSEYICRVYSRSGTPFMAVFKRNVLILMCKHEAVIDGQVPSKQTKET